MQYAYKHNMSRSISRTQIDKNKIMLDSFVNQYREKYKLENKLKLENNNKDKIVLLPYDLEHKIMRHA